MVGLLSAVRRQIFVSYHQADTDEVGRFITAFDHIADGFIARGIGASMPGDVIDSTDTEYVMRRIRGTYLKDSSITVVLIGACTWSRRYVDWELQASLRSGTTVTPNGVFGIRLPSYTGSGYPNRLNKNLLLPGPRGLLTPSHCYARVYEMPRSPNEFRTYVEDAFAARTQRAHLIVNPRDRFGCNRSCGHSWH
jgi:hypothetical protein